MTKAALAKGLTGVLIGLLASTGTTPIGLTHFSIGPAPANADTCQSTSDLVGYSSSYISANVRGVNSTINYNGANLTISCYANYYSVAMIGPTNGPNCSGAYAQIGWQASSTGVDQAFVYSQLENGQPNCGIGPFFYPYSKASHLYGARITTDLTGCYQGISGKIIYAVDGSAIATQCVDFNYVNSVQEFSERQGTLNHFGAIKYWEIEYCIAQTGSCTPNTAPGGKATVGAGSPRGRIGVAGISQAEQQWPSFNVCDKYDFTTSQC